MTVRHQVFVSSTFRDLVAARKVVSHALQQMDCIPVGMELFPASNDEQFKLIKRVIDESDYYVVIVAGRYGSTDAEGIGYTEKEFDYAVEKGIPVLAFVHADPESIPMGQSDIEPQARASLAAFRTKVLSGRVVKMWTSDSELGAAVVLAVMAARQTHPKPGWVRGPGTDTTDLLRQINDLRQEADDLRRQLAEVPKMALTAAVNLAAGDAEFSIGGTLKLGYQRAAEPWNYAMSWDRMFYYIGPDLLKWCSDISVNRRLAESALKERSSREYYSSEVDDNSFSTIRIQFMALGYADVRSLSTTAGGTALFWTLTPKGREKLVALRTVKKSDGPGT